MSEETDKKLDKEAKAYNKIVEGQKLFEKILKEKGKCKPEMSPPVIKDGKIVITFKIPIEFIKKYLGDF